MTRTTLAVKPDIKQQLKVLAAQNNTTLFDLTNKLIAEVLSDEA